MKTPTRPHTILWADDDADDRHIICAIVNSISYDYSVKEAENGCEVLRYLNTIEQPSDLPCLVVLDINMPILSGTETLRRLKSDKRYKDMKVAVFTTSRNERERLLCESYGVPMITKPSSYSDFEQAVTELLRLCHIADAIHSR